jgi:predicted RNA-binding protein with PIN domain
MAKPLTEYFWIVDGHNLVLNVPELSRLHSHESKRAARDAAEARLAELAKVSPNPVHLIFDGDAVPGTHPGSGERGGLVVRFVDPPAEADDWIVQLAKQESDAGKPVAVATSDRGLLARLAGGAPVHRMAVDAFWRETGRFARQLAGPAPQEKPDPRDSSAAELVALESAMARPLTPQEKRAVMPRASAGGAHASPASHRDASHERSKPRDARDSRESRESRAAASSHDARGPRGPRGSNEPRAESRGAHATGSSSRTESPPPAAPPARDERASAAPPPPPPPPPRDWRDEVAEKKEKGRQRQLKRLARRKGS